MRRQIIGKLRNHETILTRMHLDLDALPCNMPDKARLVEVENFVASRTGRSRRLILLIDDYDGIICLWAARQENAALTRSRLGSCRDLGKAIRRASSPKLDEEPTDPKDDLLR